MFTDQRSDEELVKASRAGDKRACDSLLERYKNVVRAMARRYFLVGGDAEDLVQEGMCGLYAAITSYRDEASFSAYARACIKNSIVDAVKRSVSGKNSALNGSLSFSEDGDEMPLDGFSPEEEIISNETVREFYDAMALALSPLEYKVMRMYMDGATMAEISASLGKNYKQADNALMRARQKIRREIEKRKQGK